MKSEQASGKFRELEAALRPLFKPYEKHFANRAASPEGVCLYTEKEIVLQGRTFKEMFFASLSVMKGHLGFYFMPVYTHPEEFKDLEPAMRKRLKGKSCFHLKKLEPGLEAEIAALLKKGFEVYKRAGWL